jgi:CBS-domain-containing membrane protein
MTSEVVYARLSTPYQELVRLLADRHIGAVPVVDDVGHVLGVVSASDLIVRQGQPGDAVQGSVPASRQRRVERRNGRGGTAAELMTWPVVTVGPQASVVEAARLLRAHRHKQLPVTDPGGRLIGIVSHGELLKVLLRSDEEIRREILDQVIGGDLSMSSERLRVAVRDGVVLVEGSCQRRSRIPMLVGAVAGVEGVVEVQNRVGFELDDVSSPPSTAGHWPP